MDVDLSEQPVELRDSRHGVFESHASVAAEPAYASEFAAIAADRDATEHIALAEVWERLSSGTARVRATFSTDARCYLVLVDATPGPSELSGLRHVASLEQLLLGVSQKVTAFDAKRAPSTISMRGGQCLRAMGLSRHLLHVPLLLLLAANAHRGRLSKLRARASRRGAGTDAELVVSVPRLDSVLRSRLSPAVCSVARMLVDGCSHAEICEARQRSERTIANQLGAAFSKLGVSGRMELVRYVLDASLRDSPVAMAGAH